MAKKKQNNLLHPKHRWLVWAVVAIVLIGVALISYIQITTIRDTAEFNASFDPRPVMLQNY